MSKHWNLVKLFESVNGIQVTGNLKETDELSSQLNEIDWSGDFADVKKTCIPPEQLKKHLNDVLHNRRAKPADRKKLAIGMPHVHGGAIPTDDLGEIDIEEFINRITAIPKQIVSVNGKMQKSETENNVVVNMGIPALKGLVYDMDEKQFYYVNTCPGAGNCVLVCYAMKGSYVMFKDVFLKQTRILNLLLNNPELFKETLENELETICQKNKGLEVIFRWNDAGDFFTNKYFEIALQITKDLQDKGYNFKSYGYSKISDVMNSPLRPNDFTINFSDAANKRETSKVDTSTVKKSVIVNRVHFSDLILKDASGRHYAKDEKGKLHFKDENGLNELKQRLAKLYMVDPSSIITYDQMMRIPEGNKPKWNVIVMPSGDGDVSAQRKDVRITFLLEH